MIGDRTGRERKFVRLADRVTESGVAPAELFMFLQFYITSWI